MEEMIFIALAGAFVGLLIGFFTGRHMAPSSQKIRDLEQRLEETTTAKERFEQRVNEHFVVTADKLDKLTSEYRDVYQHVAEGAAALCTGTSGPAFTALPPAPQPDADAIDSDSIMVAPPRDYAPKTSPDDPGMLNERFGLDGKPLPKHQPDGRS
jgi:uncharacterized membrane-anchored protein YhcB (DUF1043 family)